MRRKYSRFIKILSVIFIIVISSITNRYASEVKSLISETNYDFSVEDRSFLKLPNGQPLSSEGRSNHENQNEIQESLRGSNHQNQTLSSDNINDSQGKSIYASLIQILQNMKHQMDKERSMKRMDSEKTLANTVEMPIDLMRNGQPNSPATGNLETGDRFSSLDAKTPRNTRTIKKTQVEQTSVAQADSTSSAQDQTQISDIFNEPLKENFNEMDVGLASMAEEDTKAKKTTFSSYFGAGDHIISPNLSKKPTNQQYTETSTGDLVQPVRTFSPKVDDFISKSWNQQSTSYNSKPLFTLSSSKKSARDTSFSPAQDVSFGDYDQPVTSKFSTAYNEVPPQQSLSQTEDPPTESISMPALRINPPKQRRNKHQTGRHQLKAQGFRPHLKINSRYVVDNEYLTAAQLEQQDDDSNRWPKTSVPALEFQESLRSSRLPKPDYSSIQFHQIHPHSAIDHYQQLSPNRNKYQQNHNQQAQQQQVYYSLVRAPTAGQNELKSLTSGSTILQSSPTRPTYEMSHPGSGSQPQRDLVHQPQTIQIAAVPSLGFGSNNSPLIRINGGQTANGLPLALANYLADHSGRQIVMLNADRRQIDWSFLIYPLLLLIILPLILSALFIPIFFKSLVLFIQILQQLGLVLPISSALGLSLASGASLANVTAS